MKPSAHEEIIAYLTETQTAFKQIKDIVSQRNKTVRIKAIASILQLIDARVDASLKYAKAGGHTEFTVLLQKGMYNPIIEYLADEATK